MCACVLMYVHVNDLQVYVRPMSCPVYAATHCNTQQHNATHCNALQHMHLQNTDSTHVVHGLHCNTLQHTATPRNTMQHTATNHNTLQHSATHSNALQHTATHCSIRITWKCKFDPCCGQSQRSSRDTHTHTQGPHTYSQNNSLNFMYVYNVFCWVLQRVAMCCSVLQCIAVRWNLLQNCSFDLENHVDFFFFQLMYALLPQQICTRTRTRTHTRTHTCIYINTCSCKYTYMGIDIYINI